MKTTDQCLTCYNPSVKVKCTGKLIRVRPAVWGVDANSWITAAKCISLNGQCCDNGRTRFCPKSSPKELFCNDCYAGINTSAGCSGRLLASSYFTPSVCIKFGGRCCDGNFRGILTLKFLFFKIVKNWIKYWDIHFTQVIERAQLSRQQEFSIQQWGRNAICVTMANQTSSIKKKSLSQWNE